MLHHATVWLKPDGKAQLVDGSESQKTCLCKYRKTRDRIGSVIYRQGQESWVQPFKPGWFEGLFYSPSPEYPVACFSKIHFKKNNLQRERVAVKVFFMPGNPNKLSFAKILGNVIRYDLKMNC